MIISYTVPEIWHVTYVIVIFYFGLFFPLLPPNSKKKRKFQKNLKMPGDTSFYTIVPKIMTIGYTVPEIWCVTDVIVVSFWAIFCPFTP